MKREELFELIDELMTPPDLSQLDFYKLADFIKIHFNRKFRILFKGDKLKDMPNDMHIHQIFQAVIADYLPKSCPNQQVVDIYHILLDLRVIKFKYRSSRETGKLSIFINEHKILSHVTGNTFDYFIRNGFFTHIQLNDGI